MSRPSLLDTLALAAIRERAASVSCSDDEVYADLCALLAHIDALAAQSAATIGAKGGKATGKRKARDPAHYKRLADMKRARARK
jgi:hypothetical protein